MAISQAETVEQYLAELSQERRTDMEAVRKVVLDNLPPGYQEAMQYGMISYVVPLERHPDTYNGQPLAYASLASQKRYMSLYLTNIYADRNVETWFTLEYRASGKRLDMGKSCIRFRRLDDLPLDLIGEAVSRTTVEEFIDIYKASRKRGRS